MWSYVCSLCTIVPEVVTHGQLWIRAVIVCAMIGRMGGKVVNCLCILVIHPLS